MPNFLKSLFKPSSRATASHPQPTASSSSPIDDSPPSPAAEDQLLRDIADYVKDRESTETGLEDCRTMQEILEVLKGIRDERTRGRVSPYIDGTTSEVRLNAGGGLWGRVIEACGNLLDTMRSLKELDATKYEVYVQNQKNALGMLNPYAENRQFPALVPLLQTYQTARNDLAQDKESLMRNLRIADGRIDILIVEAIIWQAEVIDPNLGAGITRRLDEALAKGEDSARLQDAVLLISQQVEGLDKRSLDDELAKDAHLAILRLIDLLQSRLSGPRPDPLLTPNGSFTPAPSLSPAPSPGISPISTRPPTPSISQQEAAFEQLNAKALQARFGTGPIATPSGTPSIAPTPPTIRPSAVPTPAAATPDSPASPTESEQSIWEYRGQLLTRSALELVMRQEALAAADSSGQYAGEVSWDDIREAWIPKWVNKLTPGEVAEGEIPTTNPADYTEKRKDAWGNEIGWYEGKMYYVKDPKFDEV